MNMPTTDTHDVDAIESLADVTAQLRSDGYNVIVAPHPADVPAFARIVRPELVARRDGGGVIVVVRTRAELTNDAAISTAAGTIGKQPGWRLDILVRAVPA